MVDRAFDTLYRRLVLPDLKRYAELAGSLVAEGSCSFSEAYNALCRTAYRRGAVFLSDPESLEDFLATELLTYAEGAS